jgi:antitoxin component YwqK of YwqJK toxin-antitoxin module
MRTGLTLLFWALCFGASAQIGMKTVEKTGGVYTYCYHTNGKISTIEFRPTAKHDDAQGNSYVYDPTGTIIYECVTSANGMSSSVRFSYYENGAVKVAEYNSHNDAAMQSYSKTTYFDENGKITEEIEMGKLTKE